MTKTKRKPRSKPKSKPLGTIWEVPDDLWEKILPILREFWPKKPTGRRTANWRAAFNGIIFRMRTGCQWEQLAPQVRPQEHRPRLVPALVRRRGHGTDLGRPRRRVRRVGGGGLAVAERRRLAGQGPVRGGKRWARIPPIAARKGTKKSVLTDGDGGPLGVVIAGANVLERQMLRGTIEAIVVERPEPTAEEPQHLCLDEGYDNPTGREAASEAGYTPHIRRIGEEKEVVRSVARAQAAAMGRGADARLAVEVPRDPGPVRQEGRQLPGTDPTGLRPVLVSAASTDSAERDANQNPT